MLIKGVVTESSEPKMEAGNGFIDFACKKLGGIAHAKVEYFYGKHRRSLAGFACDQAEGSGISRSPFSGTFNYTVQCPLYIALENNLN